MVYRVMFCLGCLLSNGAALLGMEYRFQVLDFPGAVESYAHGINDPNVVVGGYADADEAVFGFVWQDGTFTSPELDIEEAFFNGINNAGTIVGVGIDPLSFRFQASRLRATISRRSRTRRPCLPLPTESTIRTKSWVSSLKDSMMKSRSVPS